MAEGITEQSGSNLIQGDHEVESLEQSEEKQAVMEVARLVTETELEHGNVNSNECNTSGLETNTEVLETTPATEEVQEVGRGHAGSDLAINIMSHMEISRLIANVVKRMQEEGPQTALNVHNLFHMENLLKQIVTNQNTITINQNSLLRNQQAIIQKVDVLNSLMLGATGEVDQSRITEKVASGLKSQFRGPVSSPRSVAKRNYSMDGTAALVQAAEQVGMITATTMGIQQNLNGVTTTSIISEDGNEGEQRPSGDEEQPSFVTPTQGGTDLSTISPSALYLAAGTMSPEQLTQQTKTGNSVNEVQLIRLKARSQSVGNFAVHLVRELFKPHELIAKNVSGTRNKEKLDPEKVAKIRKYVFELFPTSELDEDRVWGDCRKAMDEFLRRPNKRKNQERLSHDGLDYSMKKDKLSESPVMDTQ